MKPASSLSGLTPFDPEGDHGWPSEFADRRNDHCSEDQIGKLYDHDGRPRLNVLTDVARGAPANSPCQSPTSISGKPNTWRGFCFPRGMIPPRARVNRPDHTHNTASKLEHARRPQSPLGQPSSRARVASTRSRASSELVATEPSRFRPYTLFQCGDYKSVRLMTRSASHNGATDGGME